MKQFAIRIIVCFIFLFTCLAIGQTNKLTSQYFALDDNEFILNTNPGDLPKFVFNSAYLNNYSHVGAQTYLELFYHNQNQDKSYRIDKGKKSSEYGITARWFTPVDSTSNFFSQVVVRKGVQQDIYGFTSRVSSIYGPYQMINLKQGDYKYQNYDLSARYSKRIKNFVLGTNLTYTGDYSFKQTDPRARNISSWFSVELGSVYHLNKSFDFGLSTTYQLHRQTQELDVWKGNIKQQFFVLRGFGMIDHEHKDYVFSRKRIYTQDQFDVNLSSSLWKDRKFNIDLLLLAKSRNMKTEEQIPINLHQLKTSIISLSTVLKYYISSNWLSKINLFYQNKTLKGTENRYSYTRVNQNYSGVYDYVKIGSLQAYSLKQNRLRIQTEITYRSNNSGSYSFLLGYQNQSLNEKYKASNFRSQLDKDTFSAEIKSDYKGNKNHLTWGVIYQLENTTKALAQNDNRFSSLYNEIYYPVFLYDSLDKNMLALFVDYNYRLKGNQQIGIKVQVSKLWADSTKLKTMQVVDINYLSAFTSLYYRF
ncbi:MULTISPECIES: DUF6850 family outer membrane beta-barrel protein [Myroides]|uniref:DUF6850 domain-containing protein n=1 Tax=Myroides albus TaxID=2562892 RepID=A0A6I3LLZ1_9FLAO|nr:MULTISPECIES: DUF6850 family outer membrane beta-barrel protein [Myroides]MTG98717.1 hypothetical protein [Myroides albus]MVX36851.1 hypothetical protein [Myroides sp. LoEW2-1]